MELIEALFHIIFTGILSVILLAIFTFEINLYPSIIVFLISGILRTILIIIFNNPEGAL